MDRPRKIIGLARNLARRRFVAVAALIAAWLVGSWALAALLATCLSGWLGWRWAAVPAGAAAVAAAAAWWWWAGRGLAARVALRRALRDAEAHNPALRRRLVAAYDLAALRPAAEGLSPALADAFVADAEGRAALGVSAPTPARERFIPLLVLAGAAGAWSLASLLAPGFLAARWEALGAAPPWERRVIADVKPGDARVGAHRPFTVTAALNAPGTAPPAVVVERGGRATTVPLVASCDGRWAATFNAGPEDFRYHVRAGDERSREFKVGVVPPPAIAGLAVTVTPPAYAGLPPRTLPPGEGDVAALAGSTVAVEATLDGADEGALVFGRRGRVPLRREGGAYAGSFRVGGPDTYRLLATSPWGETAGPLFGVVVEPDGAPEVTVASPARDLILADAAHAPILRFACRDDFGLGAVRVVYYNEVSGERVVGEAGNGAGSRELEGECPLVPPGFETFPGDVIAYYVEALDNDTVNGPKAGRSPTYRFRFPTAVEMFERQNEELGADVASLEEAGARVRAFREQLEKMDVGPRPDRPALRELATRQEELRRELADAAAKLEAALARADENALSPELAAKMAEVNRLLGDVLDEQQKKTLEKLNQALREADPARVRELMSQIKLDQREMADRLERALELLKTAQREELLRRLAACAEDLADRQREIGDRLEAGATPQGEAPGQRQLAADVKTLGEMARDTSAVFAGVDEKVARELRELAAACDRGKAGRKAEDAAAAMEAGDARAAKAAAASEEELRALAAGLREMRDRYGEGQRRALLAELDRLAAAALGASHRAESLAADLAAGEGDAAAAARGRGTAATVSGLAEQANAAAEKSFFVSPALGDGLREVAAVLEAAATDAELGNRRAAAEGASRAMAGLNLAAAALLGARANAAAAGSSSGLAEAIERMKALAEGQRGVNDQGRSLYSIMPGMTPGALAEALERLAAEQALIRQGLQEMAARGSRGGPAGGDLGGMTEEMSRLEDEMKAGTLDRRILEKQEKLLERMLTATRSMRVQGRSSRRESTPGGVYAPPAVAPLPARLTAPHAGATPASGPPAAGGYVPADLRDATADYYRRLAGGE